MRERGSARAAIALAVMAAASAAQTAGGHFSVDDASLVEPGRWEQETWYSRSRRGADLLHAGFNFRVGAIELDGAAEGARSTNEPTATS